MFVVLPYNLDKIFKQTLVDRLSEDKSYFQFIFDYCDIFSYEPKALELLANSLCLDVTSEMYSDFDDNYHNVVLSSTGDSSSVYEYGGSIQTAMKIYLNAIMNAKKQLPDYDDWPENDYIIMAIKTFNTKNSIGKYLISKPRVWSSIR